MVSEASIKPVTEFVAFIEFSQGRTDMTALDVLPPMLMDSSAIVESTRELFLDFERELADIMRRRRDSSSSLCEGEYRHPGVRRRSSASEIDYESDGTIACSAITFDVLCNITGRTSLQQLKSLTLCVKSRSSSENLAVLSSLSSGLTTLLLDHSEILTLRVLGDELPTLKTLSVCGCGLQSLDGITYAPNLLTLIAADNSIEELLPVTELRKIKTIDLENNAIENYDSVSFLFLCANLESLVLKGNPLCEDPNYRSTIFHYLPSLKNLDELITPRATREFCRRNRKLSEDDDQNEGSAGSLLKTDEIKANEEEEDALCSHETEKTAKSKDKLIIELLENEIEVHKPSLDENNVAETLPSTAVPTTTMIDKTERRDSNPKLPEAGLPSKLLFKRKSQDPLRLKDFVLEETTKGSFEKFGPNLKMFLANSTDAQRPESSASISSTTTMSEATDSGIDFSSNSAGSTASAHKGDRVHKLPRIKTGILPDDDQEKLARTSKFVAMTGENSDLAGITRKEGDIEIEDFETTK